MPQPDIPLDNILIYRLVTILCIPDKINPLPEDIVGQLALFLPELKRQLFEQSLEFRHASRH
jgi:hypothetical protein